MVTDTTQITPPVLNNAPQLIKNLGFGLDKATVGYAIGSQSGKKVNEDFFWPHTYANVKAYHPIDCLIAGRLYIVADGVSGGLNGHQASKLATTIVYQHYYQQIAQLSHYPTKGDLTQALKTAILTADSSLLTESLQQRYQERLTDDTSYLQTTIVAVVIRNQTLIVASIGDSHLYRLTQQGELTRLSIENEYFIGSKLTPRQIFINRFHLYSQDTLILCSDGLYKYLSSDNIPQKAGSQIANIIQSSQNLNSAANNLVKQADDKHMHGGGDNITVMLIDPAPEPFSRSIYDKNNTDPTPLELAIDYYIGKLWYWDGKDFFSQESNLAQLGRLCIKRANTDSNRQTWWHTRGLQLQTISDKTPAFLKQAQILDAKSGLDFEQNLRNTKKIQALYKQNTNNPYLKTIALTNTCHLAEFALLAPEHQEGVWQAWQLLYNLYHNLKATLSTQERQITDETIFKLERHLVGFNDEYNEQIPSQIKGFFNLNKVAFAQMTSYAEFQKKLYMQINTEIPAIRPTPFINLLIKARLNLLRLSIIIGGMVICSTSFLILL